MMCARWETAATLILAILTRYRVGEIAVRLATRIGAGAHPLRRRGGAMLADRAGDRGLAVAAAT